MYYNMCDNNNNNGTHNNIKTIIEINSIFKIPITYNKEVQKLNTNIINDLELIKTIDDKEQPIYNYIYNPNNKSSNEIIKQLSEFYTTDVNHLKETQKLIKNINTSELSTEVNLDECINNWEEIKNDTGFHQKYSYLDWSFISHLNENTTFLHFMSLYNIASPLLALCLPIFVLIIPFFIIKIKHIELNLSEYISILKIIIGNHSFVKFFTQFNEVDNGEKLYILLSAGIYLFSIYQNILVCIRFFHNMNKIHNYLFKFRTYIDNTLMRMHKFINKTTDLITYSDFNVVLKEHINKLTNINSELNKISDYRFSLSKIGEIGHIMSMFYKFYNDTNLNLSLVYSFGFNGYVDLLCNMKTHIDNKKMNETKFNKIINGKLNKKPIFKNAYYPKFIYDKTKKHNCNLKKNMIITGPNASGKTTTLKTIIINVILSQQIGFGCFKSCKLTPFDHIHCYLNIPDTSGRDSLFQAEARRCKNIIDCIKENNDDSHFCIFDELYSGTNPEEAIISAYAFMNYLANKSNVVCLLTTHYIDLCKLLSKNKNIINYHMKTTIEGKYTYELEKGISNIKGGLKVLKDMNYPDEILENTGKYKNVIKNKK